MAILQTNDRAASQTGPASVLKPVTPNDASDLPDGPSRGLYVASPGLMAVVDTAGNAVTLLSGGGQYHPIRVTRIRATGTTAGGIVALY